MKTITIGAVIVVAMLLGIPIPFQSNQEQVEMQILAEDALKSKVKVYDYDGNLLKEMNADDVANDEISVADHFILESSGFAFQYLGDYYYLREK